MLIALTVNAAWTSRTPWVLLGVGAGTLTLVLIYFMLSRRGETRAVTKCVVLSVWAHLILFGLVSLLDWFPSSTLTPTRKGDTVRVRWFTEAELSEMIASKRPPASASDSEQLDGQATDLSQRQDPSFDPAANDQPSSQHSLPTTSSRQGQPASRAKTDQDDTGPAIGPARQSIDETAETSAGEATLVPEPPELPKDGLSSDAAPPDEAPRPTGLEGGSDLNTVAEPSTSGDVGPLSASTDSIPAPTMPSTAPPIDRDAEMILKKATVAGGRKPSSAPVDSSTANKPTWRSARSHDRRVPESRSVTPENSGWPEKQQKKWMRLASQRKSNEEMPAMYRGRTPQRRRQLAAHDGSLDTEAAVEAALKWLTRSQSPTDGRWDSRQWGGGRELRDLGERASAVEANSATTGLALMALLGAGYTHQDGRYQQTVRSGLEYLINQQSENGSLQGEASHFAAMYCHGIATLALSEAYGMTRDQQLYAVVQRAVQYTVATQHPRTGGWRYQPGDEGDTSQFGWQLMALVSAQSAGISVPESAWQGARRWLDRVRLGQFGGLACYKPQRPVPSPSMTAEALACRTFLRMPLQPQAVDEAVDYVAHHGSRPEAVGDFYFGYYATLALYQHQDVRWQRFHSRLFANLVRMQKSSGPLAGSWDPNTKWGPTGGRVYTTAMACLCLETYYRYLPVYRLAATLRRNGSRRY